MSEPKIEQNQPINKPIQNQALIHQIIGGIRLIVIGVIILAVVALILYKQMALLYPYLNPNLLLGLQLFAVIGYLIPGILFIGISGYSKNLETDQMNNIPSIVKTLYIFSGICACLGILGIRNGVKIFIAFGSKENKENFEDNSQDITDGIKSYRLYLMAGGFYQLVFGLLLIGVIELMQVVTIDLVYPDLTQNMLIGLEIWIWVCLMLPAILFLIAGLILSQKSPVNLRKNISKIIPIGAIFALFSIFGLSIGVNLMQNRWMISSVDK